ncbi:hypothetical protein NDU88_006403 [Pleurodeles waltl]|uniref:Uncharacterized protein n=1 Tax=Pleurodeles waltl TaxID=8319 RepID=A0AAV7WDH6_PLEWA|nr:hypothetical protein NDU88_006403 [Pleurodeles waltl]
MHGNSAPGQQLKHSSKATDYRGDVIDFLPGADQRSLRKRVACDQEQSRKDPSPVVCHPWALPSKKEKEGLKRRAAQAAHVRHQFHAV